MIIEYPRNLYFNEEAEKLAKILNSDPEEDWTYIVRNLPKNPRFSVIEVYDEENILAGHL